MSALCGTGAKNGGGGGTTLTSRRRGTRTQQNPGHLLLESGPLPRSFFLSLSWTRYGNRDNAERRSGPSGPDQVRTVFPSGQVHRVPSGPASAGNRVHGSPPKGGPGPDRRTRPHAQTHAERAQPCLTQCSARRSARPTNNQLLRRVPNERAPPCCLTTPHVARCQSTIQQSFLIPEDTTYGEETESRAGLPQ